MSRARAATGLLPSLAAVACVLVAFVQLGGMPSLRYAWALNLWQYLPHALQALLLAGTLALAWRRGRLVLLERLRALPGGAPRPRGVALQIVAVLGCALLLWLLRERRMYGDSDILLYNAASGSAFVFPDIGASFLFHLCQEIGAALGTSGRAVLQPAVALAGGATVYCFTRVALLLAPSRRRAVLFALLVLGGGLLRVLAGHVEVYAFVLLCAGLYFWSALACIAGRCTILWPALAYGAGLWMHLSFSFLAPSLLAVVLLAPDASARAVLRRLLVAGVVGAAPVLLFLLAMWLGGRTAELAQAAETMLRWGGFEPSPFGHEAFLRSPFGPSGAGTRYAILSAGHVKYLANAFFLLVPAALPILAVFVLVAPRRLVATPEAIFLSAGALFMLLYALVVRPVWGPYDWDLFSLTAVALAALAAYLLVRALPDPPLGELGLVLVVGTLLLVTIPFVAIGIAPAHDAGPFAYGLSSRAGESPVDAFERQLGPWL
jgi:hypothetical protein